jgi:hypothetical protein
LPEPNTTNIELDSPTMNENLLKPITTQIELDSPTMQQAVDLGNPSDFGNV